eukprot:s1251_g2.t1
MCFESRFVKYKMLEQWDMVHCQVRVRVIPFVIPFRCFCPVAAAMEGPSPAFVAPLGRLVAPRSPARPSGTQRARPPSAHASAHGASAASVLGLLSASLGAAVARRGTKLRRGPYGGYGGGYNRPMSAEEQADTWKNAKRCYGEIFWKILECHYLV